MATSDLSAQEKIKRIQKACDLALGTHAWEDYRDGILRGTYQVFDNAGGTLITEIIQAPRKRYLQVHIGAGNLDEVLELDRTRLDQHALTNECEFMTLTGRLGWDRVLPKHGWKKTGVVFARFPHDTA